MVGKSLVLIAGAAVMTATPLGSQVSLTLGADPVTHYVWRGIDVLGGGIPVQPWATAEFGATGLSVTAWGSFATADRDFQIAGVPRSDMDEMDITLDFSRDAGPLALSIGGIHYSYFSQGYPSETTTTYEAYVGAGLARLPFAPTVTAFYDFNLGDGVYLAFTGEQSVPLGRPVDLFFGVGYMDQNWRPEAGISDVNVGVGLPFSLGRLSFAPSVTYTYAPASGPLESSSTVWARFRVSLAPVAAGL
jgi:hypothetical protein